MKSNQVTRPQTADRVQERLERLLRVPQLPPEQRPDIATVTAAMADLTRPCSPVWCMARVASLLNPYFEKDTPQAVRELEMEDWLAALGGYPQWAIDRAVRFWKSAENPQRHRRPVEGDIAARCIHELRGIRAVPELMRPRPRDAEPPRPDMTPEQRAEMAQKVVSILAESRIKRMES